MDIGCERMEWIKLAWDRLQSQAHVNSVMNLEFPYKRGFFLPAE
jgi:hypothetical protein